MALPQPDENSTCLVTGASSGIGYEIARVLAKRGLGVTLVARRKERLDQLVMELERDCDIRAQAIACDLTDAEARKKLVSEVEATGLNVDLLVNNAGFSIIGDFDRLDHERQLEEIRVNVEAVVQLSRAFLPGMVERNRGGIINTASMAAFQPVPFAAVYGATKAFVLSFSEALSSELKGTKVTVTALSPGAVPTELPGLTGTDGELEQTPDFMVVSPQKVAEDAVKGFDCGKRVVVPGLANRLIVWGSHPLPTSLTLPTSRKIFSAHSERG